MMSSEISFKEVNRVIHYIARRQHVGHFLLMHARRKSNIINADTVLMLLFIVVILVKML